MSEAVSERLRALADELDAKTFKPVDLTDTLTINQAGELLRAAFPSRNFSIQVDVSFYCHSKPQVEWKVWDGKEFHKAKTLQDAYNITLRKLSEPPANALALAEESIGATVPAIAPEPVQLAEEIEADPFAGSVPAMDYPDPFTPRPANPPCLAD